MDGPTMGNNRGKTVKSHKQISDLETCTTLCDEDTKCTSLECGADQPLLDETVIKGHCSYWYNGACEKPEEFTLNPQNLIMTCKKIDTAGILLFLAFELLILISSK